MLLLFAYPSYKDKIFVPIIINAKLPLKKMQIHSKLLEHLSKFFLFVEFNLSCSFTAIFFSLHELKCKH